MFLQRGAIVFDGHAMRLVLLLQQKHQQAINGDLSTTLDGKRPQYGYI